MEKNYAKNTRAVLLSSIVVWILTYAAAFKDAYNDLHMHTIWADKLNINGSNLIEFVTNYVSYPLWHICVRIFYKLFPSETASTAAGVTALFNCLALWGIIFIWYKLANKSTGLENISFYSTCLLIVGPLSFPRFNPRYYLGQGSGNVWHNPTNIAVKGFAVLCFALIVYILETGKTDRELRKTYILLSILLFLSALAKPSFFQGIVPGLGLYFIFVLIAKGFKQHIKRFSFIVLSFVPSACVIAFQFMTSFFQTGNISDGSGIGIEFGRVLHRWSPNLGISFLLAFAFPLAVLLLNFKNLISKTSVQVTIFYELAAWLEGSFLYEIGPRESHGNWLWGSDLSMFIVWIVFLIHYFDILNDDNVSEKHKKLNLIIGIPLLFLHLIFGIAFWYSYSMFC